MGVNEIVACSSALPMHDFDDLERDAMNAPPASPGLYAWWQDCGALPGLTATKHATDASVELLYVGIAPGRAGSSQTLRSRLRSHHRGPIGSSTLRFSLTAFLWEREGWSPTFTSRPRLSPGDVAALQAWQRKHLRVQWVEHPEPWGDLERAVVEAMHPPLNRAHNGNHPAYPCVGDQRRSLRTAARQGT